MGGVVALFFPVAWGTVLRLAKLFRWGFGHKDTLASFHQNVPAVLYYSIHINSVLARFVQKPVERKVTSQTAAAAAEPS